MRVSTELMVADQHPYLFYEAEYLPLMMIESLCLSESQRARARVGVGVCAGDFWQVLGTFMTC